MCNKSLCFILLIILVVLLCSNQMEGLENAPDNWTNKNVRYNYYDNRARFGMVKSTPGTTSSLYTQGHINYSS